MGISGTEQGQLELGDEGLCSVLGAPAGMRLDLGTCLKGGGRWSATTPQALW